MVALLDYFHKRIPDTIAKAVGTGENTLFSDSKSSEENENTLEDDSTDSLDVDSEYRREIEKHPNEVTKDAQPGVQKVEAAAIVWGKKTVYFTYAWIWVAYFMLALQSSINSQVSFNAYANFSAAPQIATASVLASIVGGVLKLPIGKLLNIWGRAEGFLLFVVVYLMGIIILAACTGPASYAAGYVFYWIGYDAIYLIMDVFIADTSGLRNRAFAFAFASTPFICTAFTGPLAGQSFLNMTTWRWAYGAFAIIMPFVFAPLVIVFKYYQIKAEKMGIYVKEDTGRTTFQSIVHYIHEFDIIGCFILMAAFVLFLLPFSLETNGRAQYKSATFIVMVIIGVLLFPVFAIWEKYFARTHFIRWELFKQPTVLGATALSAILYFSFYCWDQFYYNFVMVVYDLSTSDAGYMGQIYNVGSCFWGVVFGVYVRYTNHFKNACLFFGLPLLMLGAGLMIHFRGQHSNIGYIVMCQIFIAFGGGQLVIGEDMAVMACADADGIPMMLSLIGLASSVGGAIGSAIAAAINANIFPSRLRDALPAGQKDLAQTLYVGGYLAQMEYPQGSPVRNAINYAWGQAQRDGCIAATCILVLAFPSIAVWKNFRVDRKQNKGTVI